MCSAYTKMLKMHTCQIKSFERNKGRSVSYFKPGHPQLFHRKPAKVASSDCNKASEEKWLTINTRISSFELPNVLSLASTSTSTQCSEPGVIPYRLRPRKQMDYSDTKAHKGGYTGGSVNSKRSTNYKP